MKKGDKRKRVKANIREGKSGNYIKANRNVVAMEWSCGDIYLGITKERNGKKSVMNCKTPIAKITGNDDLNKQVIFPTKFKPAEHASAYTFNYSDIQPNPNMAFCVLTIPDDIISLQMSEASGHGDDYELIKVLNEDHFCNYFNDAMIKYLNI